MKTTFSSRRFTKETANLHVQLNNYNNYNIILINVTLLINLLLITHLKRTNKTIKEVDYDSIQSRTQSDIEFFSTGTGSNWRREESR